MFERRSLRSLRHAPFRRWMVAGLVSVAGTWMQQVAQSWLVLERTGSGTAVGMTVAMQALPALTLGLWGGVVADRHDRRSILLATQAAHALLAAGLAVTVATGHASVGVIQAFALLSGVVAVFDGPASAAYGSMLVPPEDLANGLALGSAVASTGRVIGLGAAGLAVAAIGPAAAFGLNALSFLAPVAVLLAARPAPPRHPAARRDRPTVELRDGLRHVWRDDEARITIGAAWLLSCFGRNFQVTMALMAAHAFGAGADLYGRFSTLFAIGAVVGSVVAARLAHMTRRVLVYAALIAGGLQIVSGLVRGDLAFGALMVPIAAGAVVLDTATSTRVQLSTDPARRGRVMAIVGIAGTTASMVGAPLLGAVGEALGPRAPLVGGGVLTVAATVAYVHLRVGRTDPLQRLRGPAGALATVD